MAGDQIQFTKAPYIEDVGPRRIKSLNFSMFDGVEISKSAVCQVWNDKLYDDQLKPRDSGLLDPRMGPARKTGICATCHGNFTSCPGHFGYSKLALPVYNAGYFSSIMNILKSICKSCARILLSENECRRYLVKMRKEGLEALRKNNIAKEIMKKCKVTCPHCGYVNGTVKKGLSVLGIVHDRAKTIDEDAIRKECMSALSHKKEFKSMTSSIVSPLLNPVRVLDLFKRMLDVDCELLYLSDRPEKLMITYIPVPPISIRPSVFIGGGQMSNENDLTMKLRSIIQANASLRQELECTGSTSRCLQSWETLQMEVAQYINSDVRVPMNMQQSTPSAGIVQRLKGKQGRFRGNLSGKRVEYTGRTVISPDPNLRVTEVGIPILMAQILTYPERVSHHNIEKLRQCVINGRAKYPGANYIREPDGSLIDLKYSSRKRRAAELKHGCIIERHLEDGDVILFNRQPSLHRMSIMSHVARVMPWKTLRFNESVCNPYNADFDGDEMNVHVPQTEEARVEARTLMGVQTNLCTPKNGEILVAPTQDFLTSSFLITRKDTFYDRAAFSLMCSYMGDATDHVDLPTPALIKPIELWTGKQLFSVLVRPHARMRVYVNLTSTEKTYSRSGETMCPNDGYVYIRNSEVISGQLGKATLGNGNKDGLFSVLLRDYNAEVAAACMNRIAKLSARWIGNHGFSIGLDDVQPGELLIQQKTAKMEKGYEACDGYIQLYKEGKLQLRPGFDSTQTLEVSISDILNKIREEAATVCMEGLHWRNSPLIMSQCGSKGSPINISQMVACVGQQSVGNQRAPNGFIDRSLPHFPRKSKTPAAKGFVANSFYSGLTATEFFFHTMAGREGLVDTAVKTADTGYMSRRLVKGLEDLSVQYDSTVRDASNRIVQFSYGGDGLDPSKMEGKSGAPLNLKRLLLNTKATIPTGEDKNLSPSEILRIVDEELSTLEGFGKYREDLMKFFEEQIKSLKSTRRLLHLDEDQLEDSSTLLEKISLNISGITLPQLKKFLHTCITRYRLQKVEGGAPVGLIGAQSIGEPGTQMTLKTFHFAGVASMNITRGVPRILEIINAAKNIKAPVITAMLHCNNDAKSARIVKGLIEKTILSDVAKSIKIDMSSREAGVVIRLDMERISALELSISAESVKRSILQHPRMKLKEHHIKISDGRKIIVSPPETDRSKLHFALHSLKSILPKVMVQGISSIDRAVINKAKDEALELYIEGTGLLSVMGTPGVDGVKTKSNHILEVEKTLGIEAARECVISEIHSTMADYGMSIDMRHMMLLADVMTYRGEVLGIQRFGIQKMKESVLMLASFEKTADHVFNASFNGRDDNIEGVAECIIMGIPMPVGTGLPKVMQNVQKGLVLKKEMDPILL